MSEAQRTRAEAVSEVAAMTAADITKAIHSRGYAQPGMTGTDVLAAQRYATDSAALEQNALQAAQKSTAHQASRLQKAIGGPSAAHQELRKLLDAVQVAHQSALREAMVAAKQAGYLNRQADERAGTGSHAIIQEGGALSIATLMNKIALSSSRPMRVVVVTLPQANSDSGFVTSAMVEIKADKGWTDSPAAFEKHALETRAQLNEWAHESLDKLVFATGKTFTGYIAIPVDNGLFERDLDVVKAFSVKPPIALEAATAVRKATPQDLEVSILPPPRLGASKEASGPAMRAL